MCVRGLYGRIKFKIACKRYMMGMRFDKWFRSAYSEELFNYLMYRSMITLTFGFWMVLWYVRDISYVGFVVAGSGVFLFLMLIELYGKHCDLELEDQRLVEVLESSGIGRYRDGEIKIFEDDEI